MREEFEVYGLPVWAMWATGGIKLGVVAALLAGIWIPALVQPAALVLILLMLRAFAMHLKVKDRNQHHEGEPGGGQQADERDEKSRQESEASGDLKGSNREPEPGDAISHVFLPHGGAKIPGQAKAEERNCGKTE